jgi:hypothetical protein
MIEKKWPDEFRVMQTYNELGEYCEQAVVAVLLSIGADDPPTKSELLWAEGLASQVKSKFLMNLDGE